MAVKKWSFGLLDSPVELDPTLAEPHAALAVLKEQADWDWVGAEAEYRKAIGLNPNDATSHHWYADPASEFAPFSSTRNA